jgi:hypothetical protein
MINLTSDKVALVKAGFSVTDPVHQGPGRLTLRQIALPGGFAPPRKAVYDRANLYIMIGQDGSCQSALYARLLAAVHRLAWAIG